MTTGTHRVHRCDTCGGPTIWSALLNKRVHSRQEDWTSPRPHEVVQLADQASVCQPCQQGDHSRHQERYGHICVGCACMVWPHE